MQTRDRKHAFRRKLPFRFTKHVQAARQYIIPQFVEGATRAQQSASTAVDIADDIWSANEQHDRWMTSDGQIKAWPRTPANPPTVIRDLADIAAVNLGEHVYAPSAGLLGLTLVKLDSLTPAQRLFVRWAIIGTLEAWSAATIAVISGSQANFVLDESIISDSGSWTILVGNFSGYLDTPDMQVLHFSLEDLINDCQMGNVKANGCAYAAKELEERGAEEARPLGYGLWSGEGRQWRTILLGDGKSACLVLFLAVFLCGCLPLHLKESKQASGHTLNVGSGGVFSTGTAFDAELVPVVVFCGHPITGPGDDLLSAAAAEALRQICLHGLQFAPPKQVVRVLEAALGALLSHQSDNLQLPHPLALLAVSCGLQRVAQLQSQQPPLTNSSSSSSSTVRDPELANSPPFMNVTTWVRQNLKQPRCVGNVKCVLFLAKMVAGVWTVTLNSNVQWSLISDATRTRLGNLKAEFAAACKGVDWETIVGNYHVTTTDGDQCKISMTLGDVVDDLHAIWQQHASEGEKTAAANAAAADASAAAADASAAAAANTAAAAAAAANAAGTGRGGSRGGSKGKGRGKSKGKGKGKGK